MAAREYRLFIDGSPSDREFLDRIERITVDQEVHLTWEARIELADGTDPEGRWDPKLREELGRIARIRIEARSKEDWVALIDGPVVGVDADLSGEPGESRLRCVVRDDGVYLDREQKNERHEAQEDHDIARAIFGRHGQIASTSLDPVTGAQRRRAREVMQDESDLAFLRQLASRTGRYAYILPGSGPGQSKGCFSRRKTTPGDYPVMVLTGPDRNLGAFTTQGDDERRTTVIRSTFNIADKSVVTSQVSYQDAAKHGRANDLRREDGPVRTAALEPRPAEDDDPDEAARGEAERRALFLRANGQTIPRCYHGILAPYEVVSVRGGDRQSGDWFIEKVTHIFDRSNHTQSFRLARDGISQAPGAAPSVGRIF